MLKARVIPCLDVKNGRVIGFCRLDRVAGIDQIDEIDALDDAAVLDIEARDDAGFQHQRFSIVASNSVSSSPTSGGTSAFASKAGS